MNDNGYIKLHRKIMRWEWWDDINASRLFLTLLMSVNYTEGKWQGMTIRPGQTVTTLAKLSAKTNISVRTIRTCLERLKSTNEVTIETTSKYHLITVMNWALYQSDDESPTQETTRTLTNERQTNDKRTTNERHIYKKEKKDKQGEEEKKTYGEFQNVHLTEGEWTKINDPHLVEELSAYMQSTGKKYRDHYAALLNWKRRRGQGTKPKQNFAGREYSEEYLNSVYENVGEDA